MISTNFESVSVSEDNDKQNPDESFDYESVAFSYSYK